ncbi:MAG: ABC transporter ATP-binding protein [Peptococcaceae bacterium]|nr:ABC transporter ATP-binding protein [Peptococcaceae bacterium]
MPEVILNVQNLSKCYGKFTAVNDISFDIKPGEVFGFLGPNGAGKTTTMKVCTGLLKPTKGFVTVSGFDIVKQSVEAKSQFGYVPDNPFLYDKLSGREFIYFVSRLYNQYPSEQKIKELFDSFEISDKIDELIQTYSRGMRQKVALISALIHNPKILFLDEPTANLDPRSVRLTKDIFRVMTKKGGSVFLSTHVMEIAERLCDRIGVIHNGKLIAYNSVSELKKQASGETPTLEDVFFELTGGYNTETKKLLEELEK